MYYAIILNKFTELYNFVKLPVLKHLYHTTKITLDYLDNSYSYPPAPGNYLPAFHLYVARPMTTFSHPLSNFLTYQLEMTCASDRLNSESTPRLLDAAVENNPMVKVGTNAGHKYKCGIVSRWALNAAWNSLGFPTQPFLWFFTDPVSNLLHSLQVSNSATFPFTQTQLMIFLPTSQRK